MGKVLKGSVWNKTITSATIITNTALAKNDHQQAARARAMIFGALDVIKQKHRAAAEISVKAARNELLRVYVLHGWYREAEELARGAVEGLGIDRFCISREGIVREVLARVLIEAGDLPGGQAELLRAISVTRAWLTKVRAAWRLHPDVSEPKSQPNAAGPPEVPGPPPRR